MKTQVEHESCQDKINLLEAQLRSYKEEVERLRSQVVAAGRRELDSRIEVAKYDSRPWRILGLRQWRLTRVLKSLLLRRERFWMRL